MPNIGEHKLGREIEKGGANGNQRYVWVACESCGKERWTQVRSDKKLSRFCVHCHAISNIRILAPKQRGAEHPNWRGGRTRAHGYVRVKLFLGDFFYSMAGKNGYVLEHRLIMAKHLGRCLQPWEIVDHKNAIRDDNRESNLEVKSQSEHMLTHHKGYRDGYRQGSQDSQSETIKELKGEIRLLRWQVKELLLKAQGNLI